MNKEELLALGLYCGGGLLLIFCFIVPEIGICVVALGAIVLLGLIGEKM